MKQSPELTAYAVQQVSSLPELQKLIGGFKKYVRPKLRMYKKLEPEKVRVIKPRVRKSEACIPESHRESKSFVVYGRPIGYYSLGMKPNFDRMNKYHKYLKHVRESANMAGVHLPMKASKAQPVLIHTKAYYENGTHADAENVRKGIVDALFYDKENGKGSGDKYCAGSHALPMYDKESPRVEVEIIFSKV